MVAQLVALRNQLPQRGRPPLDLLPDDEEGGVRVVVPQHLHDLVGMRRGGVVERQGNDLLGRRHLEEHVGELVAQVADEEARRLVDAVDGVERQGEQQHEQHEEALHGEAVSSDPSPDGGRQAEEVEAWHFPFFFFAVVSAALVFFFFFRFFRG